MNYREPREVWQKTEEVPSDKQVCLVRLKSGGVKYAIYDADFEMFMRKDGAPFFEVDSWIPYPQEPFEGQNTEVPCEAVYSRLLTDYKHQRDIIRNYRSLISQVYKIAQKDNVQNITKLLKSVVRTKKPIKA